jgi:hypothetical protein
MDKGLIITLPDYDDVTQYLSIWSSDIITKAEENSICVRKIEGKEVIKENFEKSMNKLNYKMIIFNGHGSAKTILGHNGEPIIEKEKNGHLLKNRIVYARSCESADSLGELAKSSEGCFIGYNLPFMFYVDINWTGNPKKDPVADIFLSSSNQIPISIIKGNTCGDAHKNSQKHILKNINKVLRRKTPDAYRIAEALLNNYSAQSIIGNESAVL